MKQNKPKSVGRTAKKPRVSVIPHTAHLPGALVLLFPALLLCTVGLIAIYVTVSVSQIEACTGISKLYVQLAAIAIGIAAMLVLSRVPTGFLLKKLWIPCLVFSVAALLVTWRFGSGAGDTKSWLTVPGIPLQIQTSEFVKVLFIISFAGHLMAIRGRVNNPLLLLTLAAHVLLPVGAVVLQGDLGSALVYVFIAMLMCFASGLSVLYFAAGGAVCLAALPVAWQFLSEYQRRRILVGFDPERDPLGYGYQVILSKSAITSGFPGGSPWLELTYSKVTPAAHTDMIFSVLFEQLGIAAAIFVFALYAFIAIRLLLTAKKCTGAGRAVCVGAAALFIFQVTENIGMCMGLLPVIGLTLPFISYGGSSMLSTFVLLGIAVSAARSDMKSELK